MRIINKLIRWLPVMLFAVCLPGCEVQWVAPYSAELQKKATDMLSEVVAWERAMGAAAGTAAADPRNPDVQAKLAKWQGEIEAMSQIEIAIDPGSTSCDKFLETIGGSLPAELKNRLPTTPASGSSTAKPLAHCETLPGIFNRMTKQVTGNTPAAPGIPFILNQQCKLPWLSDDYFNAIREGRATTGAASPARPVSTSSKAGSPTPEQQRNATIRCQALFDAPPGAAHGVLVSSLIVDLDAIIYREGRQAPARK